MAGLAPSVIAVASGHGSPGRSTVALSLAAVLGAAASTVVVDADTSGPSLAAMLDADPTRNLAMVAHAAPQTQAEWSRTIESELQPIDGRSPHGRVLCGVPKPEMRGAVPPDAFARLVGELGRRFRYVVLDVGADLLGDGAALHRQAVAGAEQILLVTTGDVVGLLHAQRALSLIHAHIPELAARPGAVALVVNRHDPKFHHARAEIEWALQAPVAAVMPHDHRNAQAALAAQRPLTLAGNGRAAAALIDLAGRLHAGRIKLPAPQRRADAAPSAGLLERARAWGGGLVPGVAGARPALGVESLAAPLAATAVGAVRSPGTGASGDLAA